MDGDLLDKEAMQWEMIPEKNKYQEFLVVITQNHRAKKDAWSNVGKMGAG